MKSKVEWLIVIIFLGILSVSMTLAAPTGPTTVTNGPSSRYSAAGPANVTAVAGNVTEISFAANTVTQTWQGYFGNVTGTIVLGNSNNQSLYNWNISSPTGEVYATRTDTVPTWTNIACASDAQINAEDTALGVNQAVDQDSVNRTFLNTTLFNTFYVGGAIINATNATQNCHAVNLFNGTGAASTSFAEVLLHDGASLIYTSIIAQDANGFDNRTYDFEMLVGENGHNGNIATTPYYFYLELQ